MYGAILGDIVGSPYEFDCNNYKAKNFPLFKTMPPSKRHWCERCSDWAASIPTGVMVRGLAVGCMRMLHSPTTATETAAPCGFLLRRGWRRIWRRRCIWRSSPPR